MRRTGRERKGRKGGTVKRRVKDIKHMKKDTHKMGRQATRKERFKILLEKGIKAIR